MDYKVIIPEEEYDLLDFTHEDLPGVAVINSGLKKFEPKEVFSWHCTVTLELDDLVENGMPSQEEMKIVDKYGDNLDSIIKANSIKPNALFLARITWNGTRELVWRIFDPEITNNSLTKIVDEKLYPREFDFRIEQDKDWELTTWHLTDW